MLLCYDVSLTTKQIPSKQPLSAILIIALIGGASVSISPFLEFSNNEFTRYGEPYIEEIPFSEIASMEPIEIKKESDKIPNKIKNVRDVILTEEITRIIDFPEAGVPSNHNSQLNGNNDSRSNFPSEIPNDTVNAPEFNSKIWDIVADAGDDRIVNENVKISLDGSNSYDQEGHKLSYMWTQISGEKVTLSSATTTASSFISPIVDNGIKILTFELRVYDDNDRVGSDTVTITVDPINPLLAVLNDYVINNRTSNQLILFS